MAVFHSIVENDTKHKGELEVYKFFHKFLDDDFNVWCNLQHESLSNEVDFLILDKRLGIILVELKSYSISNIINFTSNKIKLKNGREIDEPYSKTKLIVDSLRDYIRKNKPELNNMFKGGNPKFPINPIVIYNNIDESDFRKRRFIDKVNLPYILTLKEIKQIKVLGNSKVHDIDSPKALLRKYLGDKIKFPFPSELSNEDLDIIIEMYGSLSAVRDIKSANLNIKLDENQRSLSSFFLEGNVIFEGPAGSGKTVVLISRVKTYLNKYPNHRIAVVCFNVIMANYLRTFLKENLKDQFYKVDVFNVDKSEGPPKEKYDFILIDEAQDFDIGHFAKIENWLEKNGRLNIFLDKRQAIFSESQMKQSFELERNQSFKNKELVTQYRSFILQTALAFYLNCLNKEESAFESVIKAEEKTKKMFTKRVKEKKRFRFKGFFPFFIQVIKNFFGIKPLEINVEKILFVNRNEIYQYNNDFISLILEISAEETVSLIVKDILNKVETGEDFSNFMVLVPLYEIDGNNYQKIIEEQFSLNGIPFEILRNSNGNDSKRPKKFSHGRIKDAGADNRDSFDFTVEQVRVFELFQCKGLDADFVYVIDFDKIGEFSLSSNFRLYSAKEKNYGYVCLTRAKKEITIFSREEKYSFKRLNEIRNSKISSL